MKPKLVEARKIPDWGGCFSKRPDGYVYLRISAASARFYKLEDGYIYGVAANGNVTRVGELRLVYQRKLKELTEDKERTNAWERVIGCKDLSGED